MTWLVKVGMQWGRVVQRASQDPSALGEVIDTLPGEGW